MKAGSQRRRTRQEIADQKQAEAMRLMNIETKLRQFDEMQRELNQLRQMQNNENEFNSKVKPFLKSSGLLKQTSDGSYHVPGSWEEHQQMLKMQKDEENIVHDVLFLYTCLPSCVAFLKRSFILCMILGMRAACPIALLSFSYSLVVLFSHT